MKERNRLLSGFLALILCFNLMAPAALAAEGQEMQEEPEQEEMVVQPFEGEGEEGEDASPLDAVFIGDESGLTQMNSGKIRLDTDGAENDYVVDEIEYIYDTDKITIDSDGVVTLVDGYTPTEDETLDITVGYTYYSGDDVKYIENFDHTSATPFSNTNSYQINDGQSRTGRNAVTVFGTSGGTPATAAIGPFSDVRVTAWYYDPYDDAEKAFADTAQQKFGFAATHDTGIPNTNQLGVFTNGAGNGHIDSYGYRTATEVGFLTSSVKRSSGWHKLEWLVTDAGTKMSIDGTEITTVADRKVVNNLTLATNWRNQNDQAGMNLVRNRHYIDDISIVSAGAETKNATTTVQVKIVHTAADDAYRLTLANQEGLRKGSQQRVYIEGPRGTIVKEFEYSISGPALGKVDFDETSGLLTVKPDVVPAAGDKVTVNATVKYYPSDKLLWSENMEPPQGLIPSDGVTYSLSYSGLSDYTGLAAARTGRLAGTPAATVKDGTFSPNINSTGDLVYWYYDPATQEELSREYDDQAKFGIMINNYPDLFLGVAIPSASGDLGADGVKLTAEQRNEYRTTYTYRAASRWCRTNIARTEGWHRLEIRVAGDGTTLFIDGQPVCLYGQTTPIKNTAVNSIGKVIFATNWGDKADMKVLVDNKHFIDDVYILKADTDAENDVVTETLSITVPILDVQYSHLPADPTVDATYPEPLTLTVKPNLEELASVKVDGIPLTSGQWSAYLDNGPSNASNYPAELKGWKLTVASEALQDLSAGAHSLVLTMTSGSVYTIPFTAVANTHVARSYYLSNTDGLDTNTGDSPDQAWQSFDKLSTVTFGPGDTIYLDAKSVWSGVQFRPNGSGAKGAPIVITKYNDGGDPSRRPILNGDGTVADRTAHSYLAFDSWRKFYPSGTIELFNVEHWEVRGIEITNYSGTVTQEATGRNGIAVIHDFFETQGMTALPTTDALKENAFYRAGKLQHIVIEDCYIHDVYGRHPANGASGAGSKMSGGINVYGPYDGLQIEKNIVMYCDVEGIRNDVLAWRGDTDTQFPHYMNDISISDNFIVGVPGDGVVISSAVQPRLANNYLSDAGYSYFATSASTSTTIKEMGNRQNPITMGATNFAGLWFIGTLDAVAEFNEAVNNVWTCQDGEAFDADMYCRGTVFQHNYTYRNNGGMILFMDSMYNGTIVRYNVSVEDGEGLGSAAGKKATFYYNGTPDAIYNNLFILGTNIKSMFGGSSSTVKFYNNMVVAPKANAAFHLNGNGGDDTASPGLTGEIKNNLFYPASILSEVTGSVVKADNITPASLDKLPFYDLSAFMAAQPIQALVGRSALTGASVGNMEHGKGAGVAMTPEQGRSVKAPAGAGFDYAGFEGIKTVGSAGVGIPVVLPYGRTDAVYPLTYDFFKNPLTSGFIPEIGPYQWSADPSHYVRLSYEGNGAAETLAAEAVKSGSTHTLPTPTQAGKVFGGWYDNAALTGTAVSGSYTVPADSVTLYAKWGEDGPFTVTFDSQEGTSVDPIANVEKGTAISAPAVPTREGHTFGGWYKDSAGTEPWDFTTDTVTANITLYAKWTLNKYTVTFDSREGSAVQPIADVPHGTTISAPAAPTREGHAFLGWYKEAAGENAWNFGADTVTGATTLYAKWAVQQPDTFIVTFDPQGGGNVEPILNVPANTTIASPPVPVRAGHTFLGWYKEAAGENTWNFASDTVTENTTLYAKWEINSYTVTFDVGYVGGTAINPVTAVYDTTITAPGGIVRGGYTFGGWYRDQGHTQAWSFDTDTVTANLTLYAKWTINTYTVSFNSNGGSAVDSITLAHGSLLTAPTPPVRDGHTFGGWYKDAGCTQAWNFAEDALSGNVTLYAKWTANAVGTFSVNFAAQGGTPVGSLGNIESGTTISAPVSPTREGYTFNGWYREPECINRWNFAADTVTGNITLYAKWSVYVPPVGGGGSTGSGGTTIPADGGGAKIQIPVTVDQGTGTVTIKPTEKNLQDLISNALEKDGAVLVNLSGSKNALAAEIPRDVADALAEAGVSLTARLPNGDVTLSAQALEAAAASGKPLTISTGIAPKEGLTGLQAAMSGHYDPVVNVSTSVGTAMSVGLPYTLKSGEVAEGVRAWRLNADGSRTRMAGAYDAGSKYLSFEAEGNGLYVVGFDPVALWENDYSDVAESAWYFDSVAHASYYGMFQGSNGSFDPNGTMTRAMFATVLFNLSGKPAAGGGNPFMDISEGLWYTDAVVWAYEKGVVKGVGKDAFSPDRTITRQEMMTMLLNYCAYIDCPLPELRAMSQFNDADMIADWASEAMQGLYQAGVISGKGAGEIAPADQATRAEAATLLSNFDWLVLANSSED